MSFASYWGAYGAELDRARAAIEVSGLDRLLAWLDEVRLGGGQLFVLGNGGSAASASHWACDFGKGVNWGQKRRFRVLAPADQVSWHTALSNDISYEDATAEQIRNWVQADDLVVALSVSGNSENLVRAFKVAKDAGARLVAIVGGAGGRLAEQADLTIVIPSGDYGIVEDLHMVINHAISQYLRRFWTERESAGMVVSASADER